MTAAQPITEPAREQPHPAAAPNDGEETAQALVALPPHPAEERDPIPFDGPVARLPVELDVVVPVRDFRVRTLLALEPGQLVESQWSNGEDLPLTSGQVQLAWSEFEVIDTQLAVRVTRLA